MHHRTPGRFARTAIATVAFPLLTAIATAGHAAVGTKIIVQGWEPWNDNRQPTTVPVDDPHFISGPLMNAWSQARGPLCDALKAALGRPDLVRSGITLYNISCQFNAADIRLEPLSKTRAKFVVLLPAGRIAATSTTPTLAQLGADAPLVGAIGLPGVTDPRFSVTVDAQFELDVEIGDAPAPLLTVRQAHFNLKRADARGENITGKLGEWVASKVVPFFGGPNFERLAESRIDAVGHDVLGQVRQALKTVNDRVAPYAKYVRVGTWMSTSRIALAFQPRNIPAPALGGEMRGLLVDQRIGAAHLGQSNPCEGFKVTAQYQAEPRPILNPDRLDDLGPARMVPVGSFLPQGLSNGVCRYTVRGLAIGVTNTVQASHPLAGRGSSGSLIRLSTVLLPRGWDGHTVTPRTVASDRNYVLATDLRGTAPVVQRDPRRQVIDPLVNVVSPAQRMAAPIAARSDARTAIASALDKQALNPQPLPPRASMTDLSTASQGRVQAGPSAGVAAIGSLQALNPQPLPPKLELTAPVLTLRNGGTLAIGAAIPSITASRLSVLH